MPPGGPEVGRQDPLDGQGHVLRAHPMPVPRLQEDQVLRGILVRGGPIRGGVARPPRPEHRAN
eukprot:13169945-Alexandrium_andersonii.AAC.1